VSYQDVELDDSEFEVIGNAMAAKLAIARGNVGNAECRLMSPPNAFDFAAKWMAMHRRNPALSRVGNLCKL
jgi:aminoglycoside 3-N-acetyltransferase